MSAYPAPKVFGVKGVIFDLDGLLVDSERLSFACWKSVTMGSQYAMDEIYPRLIGRGVTTSDSIMASHFGPNFPIRELRERKNALFNSTVAKEGIPAKDGARELLGYLHDQGIKIGLATSSTRETAQSRITAASLEIQFDATCYGNEVTESKPNPEIFQKVAERLRLDPIDCLVLEDSVLGIEAALNAGMKVVMVPDLLQPEEWMYERDVAVVSSLSSLVGSIILR